MRKIVPLLYIWLLNSFFRRKKEKHINFYPSILLSIKLGINDVKIFLKFLKTLFCSQGNSGVQDLKNIVLFKSKIHVFKIDFKNRYLWGSLKELNVRSGMPSSVAKTFNFLLCTKIRLLLLLMGDPRIQ